MSYRAPESLPGMWTWAERSVEVAVEKTLLSSSFKLKKKKPKHRVIKELARAHIASQW